MNRKEFFKKLGLGALVAVVAPKMLADDGYTEGLIPFIKRIHKNKHPLSSYDRFEGLALSYKGDMDPVEILRETGNIICKKRRMGHTAEQTEFMKSVLPYQRYNEEAWRKFEATPMKGEKERVIKDLILYGRAETKLL
jgi:hypothetical protein